MDKFEDAAGFIVRGAAVVGSAIIAGATLGTALALGGLAIGVRLLGSAIQGRPSRVQAQQANYDPTATCKVVYGRTWVGLTGADIWVDHDDVSDHESLWAFGVFSVGSENGQGVEDVEKIKLDGILAIDPVTTGGQVNVETGRTSYYAEDDLLSYNVRLGTDAQGVNTDAQGAANNASDRYPDSFRFRGLCYAAFNMWKHKDVFPNFPRSISARVKGVRVYDPRNPTDGPDDDGFIWDAADTTASLNQNPGQNPALLLLDYLTSARYGDKAFYPERDGGTRASVKSMSRASSTPPTTATSWSRTARAVLSPATLSTTGSTPETRWSRTPPPSSPPCGGFSTTRRAATGWSSPRSSPR